MEKYLSVTRSVFEGSKMILLPFLSVLVRMCLLKFFMFQIPFAKCWRNLSRVVEHALVSRLFFQGVNTVLLKGCH